MEKKLYTEEDFRTIDELKKGFINCLFPTPHLIVATMRKYFGDADLTLHEDAPTNSFTIECMSKKWCLNPYHRTIAFKYEKCAEGDENKIIALSEIV